MDRRSFWIARIGTQDGDVVPEAGWSQRWYGRRTVRHLCRSRSRRTIYRVYEPGRTICLRRARLGLREGGQHAQFIHRSRKFTTIITLRGARPTTRKNCWVVRKGATPAFPGQKGFVGGTMGETSVILEGIENEDAKYSLYSTVHGAGRIMGRMEAKGKLDRKTGEVKRAGRVTQEMMDGWLMRGNVRATWSGPGRIAGLLQTSAGCAGGARRLHTKILPHAYAGGSCDGRCKPEHDPYKDGAAREPRNWRKHWHQE